MSEIIKFPGNGESSDKEKQAKQARYDQLENELEELERRLEEMVERVGTGYDDLSEEANWQIPQLQMELAEMRERKFYSPIKRRKILEELKSLRVISKTADALVEEYRDKAYEYIELAKQLGIPENDEE